MIVGKMKLLLPDTLSPSQLSTFLKCPVKWKYRYVDKLISVRPKSIAMEKGSYIHELFHLFYGMLEQGVEIGDPLIIQVITDRVTSDIMALPEEERDWKFQEVVTRIVFDYIKNRSTEIDLTLSKIEAEVHLEYEFDGRNFHGYADLIYYCTRRKRWVIRDHKTGGKDIRNDAWVESELQLLFYACIFYLITGEVAILEVSWIQSNPPKKVSPESILYGLHSADIPEIQLLNYWDYIKDMHEAQQNPILLHNRTGCSGCPYYPICRAELRGYSADGILRANYGQVQPEDSKPDKKDTAVILDNYGWGGDRVSSS